MAGFGVAVLACFGVAGVAVGAELRLMVPERGHPGAAGIELVAQLRAIEPRADAGEQGRQQGQRHRH